MSPHLVEEGRGPLGRFGIVKCESCGKDVWFLNPTPDRVGWYERSHRCGGDGWQG